MAVVGIAMSSGVMPLAADPDPLLARFARASEDGQCIESVTYRMLDEQGTAETRAIVRSALNALARHADRQRALGCPGDIAAQAIAAGADPAVVLSATAAGL